MHIGNQTTSANEGYHSGLKSSDLGPNGNDPMHITAMKIVKMTDSKEGEKSQKAAYDSNSTYGKAKDRKRTVQQFSTVCNSNVSKEYASSVDFFQFRANEYTFLVKYDYDKVDNDETGGGSKKGEWSVDDTKKLEALRGTFLGKGKGTTPEYKTILHESMKYIIPRFEHTRVVELKKLPDGTWVIVCSCGLFKTMGYACRHMYKVLKRDPTSSDAKIRWHNGYCEDYGRNNELTKAYMELRSVNLPGVSVTDNEVTLIKTSMQIGCGERDEGFFSRSLNKLCLRGRSTFWHENADRFHQVLQGVTHYIVKAAANTAPTQESDTAPMIAGLAATCFGPARMIHSTSVRAVPSQSVSATQNSSSSVPMDDTGVDSSGDSNARKLSEKFLPRYQHICKYAESCGDEG
eukprot:scaffold6980_cov213-Alexandrium_tamarense.AAC.1